MKKTTSAWCKITGDKLKTKTGSCGTNDCCVSTVASVARHNAPLQLHNVAVTYTVKATIVMRSANFRNSQHATKVSIAMKVSREFMH